MCPLYFLFLIVMVLNWNCWCKLIGQPQCQKLCFFVKWPSLRISYVSTSQNFRTFLISFIRTNIMKKVCEIQDEICGYKIRVGTISQIWSGPPVKLFIFSNGLYESQKQPVYSTSLLNCPFCYCKKNHAKNSPYFVENSFFCSSKRDNSVMMWYWLFLWFIQPIWKNEQLHWGSWSYLGNCPHPNKMIYCSPIIYYFLQTKIVKWSETKIYVESKKFSYSLERRFQQNVNLLHHVTKK